MANDNNPYLDTVDSIFGDDGDSDLRQSLIEGMKSNPDNAAKALPYAKEKQIPLDMAERNLPDLEAEKRFNDIDFQRLQKESPLLGDFLRDQENARIAHDDIGFLENVGRAVGRGFNVGLEGIPDMTAATYESVKNATGLTDNSKLPVTARIADDGNRTQPSFSGYGEAVDKGVGFGGKAANVGTKVLEDIGQGVASSAPSFVLGAGGGIAGAQVAGPLGAAAGTIGGAYLGSSSQTIGEFYRELEQAAAEFNADPNNTEKINYQDVGLASLKWGAALAAPDAIVPGKAGGRVVNATVRASIKQQAMQSLRDAVTARAAKQATKELLQDTATEAVTEGIQEAGQIAGVSSIVGRDAVTVENAQQVIESALSGAAGGLGMSGASQAASGTINITKGIVQANENKNYLAQVRQALADPSGKLPTRSPEKTREYLNQITGNTDLYIDGKAVQEFYQSLTPQDQQAIEAVLPNFTKDMTAALDNNGDMIINRADYFTYIQPRDTQAFLDENARFMPEHLSAADIAEYDTFMSDVYNLAQDMSGLEEGEIVENNLYNQFLQRFGDRTAPSGRTDVARMLAGNARSFYETMVDRYGDNNAVRDVLDRLVRDLEIVRPLPDALAQSLRKGDFDLQIDRVRARRSAGGKAKTKYPLMNVLKKRGKIRLGSPIAGELSVAGITPQRYPDLFSAKGKLRDLDNLVLSEVEAELGVDGIFNRSPEFNGYVSRQEFIDRLADEHSGKPIRSLDESLAEMADEVDNQLLEAIGEAGLDINTASNAEIKLALQAMLDRQRAGTDQGGQSFDDSLPTPEELADLTEQESAVLDSLEQELQSPPEFAPAEKPAPIEQQKAEEIAETLPEPAKPETERVTDGKEKPQQAITDFGEKLAGARKDAWKSFNDSITSELPEDAKDITLSKHFPEPDYDALIAAGVDPKILATIKAIRDEIPAKPQKPYRLKQWAATVKQMRDLSADLMDGGKTWEKFYAEGLNRPILGRFFLRIELYSDLGYPTFLKAKGWDIDYRKYLVFNGVKQSPPKGMWTIRKMGVATEKHFEERRDAVNYLRSYLDMQESSPATKQVKLDIYQVTKTGEIIIGKKVGAGKWLDLKGGFTSVRDARAYLKENEKPLLVLLEQRKTLPPARRSANDPRRGEDYRLGENIAPEKFAAEFGFRGVQFGNYVEQQKRADDLNNAYDALLDMARIIGAPSKALSLNGSLGLAFGARGSGGKDAPAAHYESGHVVINLTKRAGAGSLAHEWWHALDNYFGKKNQNSNAFLTDAPRTRQVNRDGTPVTEFPVRPELVDAFAGVMKAIKQTGMYKRSKEADKTRSKDYWSTDIEMSARAYEAYIIYKAAEKGEANDYLANITGEKAWNAFNSASDDVQSYPYPTQQELADVIAPAFDKLFATIETRQTDKGVEFFQKAPAIDSPAFARWFGDSKVVDENGQPLVVYHGSPDARFLKTDDAQFKGMSARFGGEPRDDDGAFWFASSKATANSYADDRRAFDYQNAEAGVEAFYVSLKNPLIVEANGKMWRDAQQRGKTSDVIDEAREKGHDGVIIRNVRDDYNNDYRNRPTDTFLAFRPEQIKSVNNRGTFDPADPRILYQRDKMQYPIAPRSEWYGEGTYKESGGRLVSMSPDEYLSLVRPLQMDELTRENIDLLKDHIQSGKTLDPLLIRENGKEDGRHRAYAAKELGIEAVPVIVYGSLAEGRAEYSLYQSGGKDGARGSIKFMPDGRAIMTLFEKENLSTVLHEFGHLYWKVMTEIAVLPDAPEQIVKDVDTVRAWAGAKPLAESSDPLTVEQEEKIADGFLEYLRKGDAPSSALQSAFVRFKGWLTRLYRGYRDTLPKITPEVKDVFDRMLATDDAINALGRESVYQVDQAILNMLPKSEAARFQRKMERAIEEAKERLFRKAMRQSEKRNTQEWKEAEAKLREEITASVDNERVYRAIAAIKDAGGLSRSILSREWGQEVFPYLKGHGGLVARKGGAEPIIIASLVGGYSSSRNMISDIMNAKPRQQYIDEQVEEQMLARYGDMLKDGTIEREAHEQMHNELRAEILHMEMEILADLAEMPAPTKDGIKAMAIKRMAETKVKDIIPARWLRSENKAYFEYGRALGKKDFSGAAKAKAQQLFNHHLYRLSLEAQRDIDKKMKTWRRILNKTDEKIGRNRQIVKRADGTQTAASIDMDYVYVARAILAKYGIGKSNYDFNTFFANMRRDDPDSADTLLAAYAMLTDGAPNWEQSQPNVRGVVSKTAPYKQMQWADFMALADAVDNVIEVGRNQKFIEINGQKVEKQKALDDLTAQARKAGDAGMPTVSKNWTAKDKARKSLWSYAAATARVDRWVRDMDRGYTGAFHDYIWNPIQDASTQYRDKRKAVMEKIVGLLNPHKDRLHGEPIEATELVSSIDGLPYVFEDKAELIGMLMHTGNGFAPGSNGYKLLLGMGWAKYDADLDGLDTSSFDAFMKRIYAEGILTKEDMDLVQDLWNVMDELKPAVWKAHKKMYGFYPDDVTSVPFMTPFGEYKGGYWPAIVDKNKSRDAAKRENVRIAENENNITAFPTTGRGATKSRVDGYAAPLELSLRLLPNHVDWAMRFVHIEPVVKDVAKLMLDKDFSGVLENANPGSVDEMIMPWLQRVARQSSDMPVQQRFWRDVGSVAAWGRRTTGMMMMAGNVINIAMQFTGVAPLMYKVGARNFARSWLQWVKSPSDMSTAVNNASGVMRNAMQSFIDQDFERRVKRIIDGETLGTKVSDMANDYGYIGQKAVQSLINNVGWTAAYNQAYGGKVKGIEAADDQAAIRYADEVIAGTQGFNNVENVSAIEAQTALGKLFLVFYSYFNNQANFLLSESRAIKRSDAPVASKAASAFYLYLMCYMAPSFVADLIGASLRDSVPDDEDEDGTAMDEWFQFYLISQAKYATATVPYVGQAMNYVVSKFTPQKYDDQISVSPVFSTAEKALSAPFSLKRAMFDDGDKSKAVGDTLTAIGLAPGMAAPVGFAMRPAKWMADLSEGDSTVEGPVDVIQGLTSGRSAAEKD